MALLSSDDCAPHQKNTNRKKEKSTLESAFFRKDVKCAMANDDCQSATGLGHIRCFIVARLKPRESASNYAGSCSKWCILLFIFATRWCNIAQAITRYRNSCKKGRTVSREKKLNATRHEKSVCLSLTRSRCVCLGRVRSVNAVCPFVTCTIRTSWIIQSATFINHFISAPWHHLQIAPSTQ